MWALAMADTSSLRMTFAALRCWKRRMAMASSMSLPRIMFATMRAFRGDMRV